MKKKIAVLVVLCILLVAFAAWGSESKMEGQTIDISKMSCKDMMSGNDTDRAVVAAFFQGYLAGKKNNVVVNVDAASDLSDKVRDYCLSNPKSTVMDAFAKGGK